MMPATDAFDMTLSPGTLRIILVMAAAVALCRLAGFWLMRFVPMTPRVAAGLNAIPLAVMIGIMLPPVLRGGLPEAVALAATLAAARFGANDLVAVLVGMASVAIARAVL